MSSSEFRRRKEIEGHTRKVAGKGNGRTTRGKITRGLGMLLGFLLGLSVINSVSLNFIGFVTDFNVILLSRTAIRCVPSPAR